MDDELMNTLRYLRLRGLLAHWDEYVTLARKQHFSLVRLLRYVVEEESKIRQEHARQRRLARARIPELWRMEAFPFARQPKLDKKRILSLYDAFDYMTQNRNLIWVGPTGCGKTGLATGFLIQAIQRGYTGRYVEFAELVAELFRSVADHSEQQILKRDGRLVCWGDDGDGQVSGPNGSTGTFTAVSARGHDTCALGADGSLACWGDDGGGQIAGPNGSTGPFTAVSVGGGHTCAVRMDGRLACWGDETFCYDCGDPEYLCCAPDGRVSGPNGSTDTYSTVSAGSLHTCALRTDGHLACWGTEDYYGNWTDTVSGPNASGDIYTDVIAGNYHTCALRTDGRLACWGADFYGEVYGPNGSTDTFYALGGADDYDTCALRAGGGLVCWGYDGDGRVSGASTDRKA